MKPTDTEDKEPMWVTMDRFSWCPEAQRKAMLAEIQRLASE